MGCSSSSQCAGEGEPADSNNQHHDDVAHLAIKSVQDSILAAPKWMLLKEWCGWHAADQFGYPQTTLEDVIGTAAGRTKLCGVERPNEYQVR